MLVTQVVSRPLSLTEQGLPADVLDLAAHEQERLLDDVITQRVSVKRGHIERGLHPLLHTSYDLCHCCQDKFAEAVCRSDTRYRLGVELRHLSAPLSRAVPLF